MLFLAEPADFGTSCHYMTWSPFRNVSNCFVVFKALSCELKSLAVPRCVPGGWRGGGMYELLSSVSNSEFPQPESEGVCRCKYFVFIQQRVGNTENFLG